MYLLIKLFYEICLFKKGPQDVPISRGLLFLLIPCYAGVSFLILILNTDVITAVLQVLVELVLVLGLTNMILLMAKKESRYLQTVSALIGTDTIISFFAIPVMATLVGQGSVNSLVVIVILMIWHWLVSGAIFSHALERPLAFGIGVAFLYILVSYQVMGWLFPEIIMTE